MAYDPFEYIRTSYSVPAHKGARVEYSGGDYIEHGTVTRAEGAHVMIKLDGKPESGPYHPTWALKYLDDDE